MEQDEIKEETASIPLETQPVQSQPTYTHFILPGAILVAALIISGTLFLTRNGTGNLLAQGKAAVKSVKVSADDHILGNPKAKITMVEFSDFQCPFCRAFWQETLAKIKNEYIDTGKIRFVYKHFPLSFHPTAQPSAEASECANEQGKFWEFHDKIFEEQAKKGQATIQYLIQDIKKWAGEINLDQTKFSECLDSGKYKAKVQADFEQGSQLGVDGTPGFFINGQPVKGALPFEAFKAVIDKL